MESKVWLKLEVDTGVFHNSPSRVAELISFSERLSSSSLSPYMSGWSRETTWPLFSHPRQWRRSMVWSSHLFSTCLMQTPILPMKNKPYSPQCFMQSIWKLIKPEKYCIVLPLAEWLFWPVFINFYPFCLCYNLGYCIKMCDISYSPCRIHFYDICSHSLGWFSRVFLMHFLVSEVSWQVEDLLYRETN